MSPMTVWDWGAEQGRTGERATLPLGQKNRRHFDKIGGPPDEGLDFKGIH